MLTIYDKAGDGLCKRDAASPCGENSIWFDLVDPSKDEDAFVEQAIGVSVPTRAEMREIEASSRLYQERGAHYMTTFIVYNLEAHVPSTTAVTFILAGQRLVTVRYTEPKAFPLFLARVESGDAPCTSAAAIMIGLIETMIHRTADLIERVQDDVDKLAQNLFELDGGHEKKQTQRLGLFLKHTGKHGDIVARVQESTMSMDRLLLYFYDAARGRKDDPRTLGRIDIAHRDIAALLENMRFLSNRMSFLLDATLGMISNEQNQIIKLFSVMAVMLMPPTLVASIYGMNFKLMPELDFPFGYPMALGLMFISGLVPYVYFKRRGWL
jgi:magnesium transporter